MTTTTATYDADLSAATSLYDELADREGYPEGEYEKTRNDRLNNAWIEGITVQEWVDRAILGEW